MSTSDLVILLAALCGAAMSYEYGRHPVEGGDSARFVVLVALAFGAVGMANSVHGFLYVLLMPIGAYKVVRIVTAPVLVPLGEARRASAATRVAARAERLRAWRSDPPAP